MPDSDVIVRGVEQHSRRSFFPFQSSLDGKLMSPLVHVDQRHIPCADRRHRTEKPDEQQSKRTGPLAEFSTPDTHRRHHEYSSDRQ